MTAKNDRDQTVDTWHMGGEQLFGYQALRIYRHVLAEELFAIAKEREIPVIFNKKFSRVISESDSGVTFGFTDGSSETASLLIGADGIYSKVRQYINSSAKPAYIGIFAIGCAVQKSKLRFPIDVDYPLPVSIHGKNGFFLLAPQTADGEDLVAGTQRPFPDQGREGWQKLASDKGELLGLLRQNLQDWPDIVQSALENLEVDTFYIWPYHTVPRLDSWMSPSRRVILSGDAAHAIPPTVGQGANQAFEDAYSLALILSKLGPKLQLQNALDYWQSFRQERIDKILDLTAKMNQRRLPTAAQGKAAETKTLGGVKNAEDSKNRMKWLYEPRLEEKILSWVANRSESSNEEHSRVT